MLKALALTVTGLVFSMNVASAKPVTDTQTIKSLPAPTVATDGSNTVELWDSWGVSVANIETVKTLVSKNDQDGTRETLRLVVVFNGLGTDVSPTHTVYLTYQLASEMSNITSAFRVADVFGAPEKIRRTGPGKYSFVAMAFDMPSDNGFLAKALHEIDATQLWLDIKARKDARKNDFDDGELASSIVLTRTAK